MTRDGVNELVLECLRRYEDRLDNPNPGKAFPELYDTDTLEPGNEWLDHYHQVGQELTQMGLDIHGAWRRVLRDRDQSTTA